MYGKGVGTRVKRERANVSIIIIYLTAIEI
jgi:hypothetical protein